MNRIIEIKKALTSKKTFIILIICLFIGVIFIVSGNQYGKNNEIKSENKNIVPVTVDSNRKNEIELEEILTQIKGVGDVKVMIVYGSTEKKILEKDLDSHGNEKTVTKNESSNTEPFVVTTITPDISGVIVAAKGGGNMTVKNMITNCISDVLSVPVHKVKVMEMK